MSDVSWFQALVVGLLGGMAVGVARLLDKLDRVIRLLEIGNNREG